jgi:hypothetical protein
LSPKEAIEAYIKALDDVGVERTTRQFKVENGRIRIGYVYGEEVDDVQWGMMSYTPEEFMKLAYMRALDLGHGDPKKPWRRT